MRIFQNIAPVRRKAIILVLAAIALLIVLLWLRPDPPPPPVTATARFEAIEDTVVATGTIDADDLVSVGAQASGQVKSLNVELGDRVAKGDVIAEIDSTNQRNSLRNAEAALSNVRAQRAVQAAALRQAELAFRRQDMMLAEDATARADYDNARATLESSRAQVASLDAQIRQSRTSLDTAQANLGYTHIVAPIAGTVVAIVAQEGQTLNAVQSSPTIIKLAKLDTVTVRAEISEADVMRVKPGQTVYFTTLGDPDRRYYATLRSIAPAPESIAEDGSKTTSGGGASDDKAVYYNGYFDVDNPDGSLRISMTAQVNIVLDQAKRALVIPSSALGPKRPDGTRSVQVLGEDKRPAARVVRVGIDNRAKAQILSGLKAGEQVVVAETAQQEKPESEGGIRPPRRPEGPGG